MIFITRDPLNPEAVTRAVHRDINGAVVTFLGVTRCYTEGKEVLYLEYEAYLPMAEAKLREIVQEVRERWGIEDIAIAHRIGHLEIGEISLVVAIASPHREKAFQASEYAVDRLKQTVPIWKKEVFADGEVWVGAQEEPHRYDVAKAWQAEMKEAAQRLAELRARIRAREGNIPNIDEFLRRGRYGPE
jgi:molybdopterin synthase catalytic subunit